MAGMQNVNEALAALPSLPPGSISVQRLPNVQNQGPSLDAQPGKARGRPRRSPQRLRRPTDAHGNSQDYAGGRFARGGGQVVQPDSAALEHRRMLCRSLPTTQHLLEAPQPREDCRFVQLQLTVLLQGCASVEGGGDAYRTLIVSGNATLYETAQAISAAFGLIDARDISKPLPPKLECIFEDVLVGEDGLTIENREIAGLEWRDHATRVFHPEKQLRGLKTAALLDRPLFRRPRGERRGGGTRSHVSLLVKTADEPAIDPTITTPRTKVKTALQPRNGLYPFTVRCTAAGLNADMRHKSQQALPRVVAGGGAALGGSPVDYDVELSNGSADPAALDALNAQFFQAFHAKRGKKTDGDASNLEKQHLRLPLVTLDLAAEYAQRNDL